jgi:hypothetical protein
MLCVVTNGARILITVRKTAEPDSIIGGGFQEEQSVRGPVLDQFIYLSGRTASANLAEHGKGTGDAT